jgi:hypothetical protein
MKMQPENPGFAQENNVSPWLFPPCKANFSAFSSGPGRFSSRLDVL